MIQSQTCRLDDLETPKITLCVAVYNVEPYLAECLDSLAAQSLREVEFIIVDDGSTDGSGSICDMYAQNDPRFHVIHHEKNQGLMLARKTGICRAKGQYLMFLDGDDRLASPKALCSLAERLEIEKVDVLRFCVECFGENAKRVQSVQRWLSYRPVEAQNGNLSVLRLMFESQRLNWSAVCHAYRTEIAKKATSFCPDEKITMAEDVFWSFILISLSKSYKWIQTEPVFSYRIGSGISTTSVTVDKFEQLTMQCRVPDWLKIFVDSMQFGNEYLALVDTIRKTLTRNAARCFIELPISERGRGFELLARWGHLGQLAEAIQHVRMEGVNTRKLYSFEAFQLWILGRIAFSRTARHGYRARLIELLT